MKKILVTGANGFIGSKTLKLLLNKNCEIHATTRQEVNKLKNDSIKWHRVNLLNIDEIDKLLKIVQPTDILHLGWYTSPGKYNEAEENLYWVQSSIELLKKFKMCGGKRFVFAGTCFQYELNYGYLSEYTTPSKPNSLYGICKYSFESMASKFCCKNGLSFASGRIFYLYGEKENGCRVIPYVINSLLNNEIAKCSTGDQIRDFMHVEDVASAFVQILYSNIEGVINVGSGEPVKLREVLTKIGKKLNKVELIHFGDIETSFDEPAVIVANNNILKTKVNWMQHYDLDAGIEKTIEWWKKNRMKS